MKQYIRNGCVTSKQEVIYKGSLVGFSKYEAQQSFLTKPNSVLIDDWFK